MKFEVIDNDSGEYKIEAILGSAIYTRESELGHLLSFYYLILWKRYLEENNTLELALVIQWLGKLISFVIT